MSTLMVSKEKRIFKGIMNILIEKDLRFEWCTTGTQALSLLLDKPFDLLITEENLPDMTGPRFIESVIMHNPMINCAVSSPLTKKKFHQAYEGFGILMQLPVMPGRKEGLQLLHRLEQLSDLVFNKTGIAGEQTR